MVSLIKSYLNVLRLDHLGARYIFIGFIFSATLLVSSVWSIYYIKGYTEQAENELHHTAILHANTAKFRNHLWHINYALQAYLITPEREFKEEITQHMSQLKKQAQLLISGDSQYEDANSPILNLYVKINVLEHKIIHISNLRTTPSLLHPAMELMTTEMLPANTEFNTAVTLARDEIAINIDADNNFELYFLLDQIRDNWNKIISTFRVYITNRHGIFPNAQQGMTNQAQDIETLYEQTKLDIFKLQNDLKHSDNFFELEPHILNMKTYSNNWYNSYINVKNIYISDQWRSDLPYLKNDIYPIFLSIWSLLAEIDGGMQTHQGHLKIINDISSHFHNFVWFYFFFLLLLVSIGFYLTKKHILAPIISLAYILKAESGGKLIKLNSHSTIYELKLLEDTFSTMRERIHERQQRLEYQATHDSLTTLPNRIQMQQVIERYITNDEAPFCLLILDLNGFKDVNDNYGHEIGDFVLIEVANRLKEVLRFPGLVSRLGGDEFAIVIPGLSSKESRVIVERIGEALNKSIVIENTEHLISTSIGVSIYPDHGSDMSTLLRHADIAMYHAKKNKVLAHFYDPKNTYLNKKIS